MEFSLKQAKRTNPNAIIHVIGDHTNNIFNFVKHYNISNYCQNAQKFEKVYKHLDSLRRIYVLSNIKAYSFMLNEFIISRNIDRFLLVDTDVMIYCNVEKEFERLKEWDFSLGETIPGDLAMCPSPVFWNNVKALDEFCKFVMNVYTGKDLDNYNKAVDHYEDRRARGLQGGVCVMTLYALFERSKCFKVYHVENVENNSTHELNLNISTNGLIKYQMEGRFKRLEWKDGCPYGICCMDNKRIRFKTIHCAGGAKGFMKGFYEM
ncbi:MAG: hypothetical protein QQN62_03840 [Nitrosopumilus sp.]